LGRLPRFPHGRDLLAEFRAFHERWCEFQESRGLLVAAPGGNRFHASGKTALRGVAAFLNPLADNFTPSRLALPAAPGVGIPVLSMWLLDVNSPLRPHRFPLIVPASVAIRIAVLAGAYAAGGVAIAHLLTSKSFIWGALLGYSALRLTGASGAELLLAAWLGFVGHHVSRALERRAV